MLVLDTNEGGGVTGGGGDDGRKLLNGTAVGVVTGVTAGLDTIIVVTVV